MDVFALENAYLYRLAVAFMIGLLIGVERGWHAREAKEGKRIAGIRTFTLIGLLGGIAGLLTEQHGAYIFGTLFLGFSLLITFSYVANIKKQEDIGITTLVAALVTFGLGGIAVMGYIAESSSLAIIVALLLRLKPLLHHWLEKIERKELLAALELLLISVVLLNILPNRNLGPWQAFNPFEIWWMVVFVATLSFVGYFAMKLAGPKKGVLVTALFAGFISSTVLTLHFARLSRQETKMSRLLGAGILMGCGIMFFRMLFFVFVLKRPVFYAAFMPLSLMGLFLLVISLFMWKKAVIQPKLKTQMIKNPLELKPALLFGALLSVVSIAVKGAYQLLGDMGIYLFSALSGLIDIDAIVLSLSRMKITEGEVTLLALGVIIAAVSNTLLKATLAFVIGGRKMGLTVSLPLLGVAILGFGLNAIQIKSLPGGIF